jgi:hypothetical protein
VQPGPGAIGKANPIGCGGNSAGWWQLDGIDAGFGAVIELLR